MQNTGQRGALGEAIVGEMLHQGLLGLEMVVPGMAGATQTWGTEGRGSCRGPVGDRAAV